MDTVNFCSESKSGHQQSLKQLVSICMGMENKMAKKHSAFSLTLGVILCVSIMCAYGNSNADELQGTPSALKQRVNMKESSAMFHALDKMTVEEQASIRPMTDDQLASIEGGRRWRGHINLNLNIAVVVANNICVFCSNVGQSIIVDIGQSNN